LISSEVPPEGKPVGLRFEQRVQFVKTGGLPRCAVERAQRVADRLGERGMLAGELREPAFVQFLVPVALGNLFRDGVIARGQMRECRGETGGFRGSGFGQSSLVRRLQSAIEDARVFARIKENLLG
jgi:hypothetical protein